MNDTKILIVTSNYYEEISNNLIKSTTDYLNKIKISFDIENVLGSLEIPQAINFYLSSSHYKISSVYQGFIALGCVIKGETFHFEIVSNESNRNLMNLFKFFNAYW